MSPQQWSKEQKDVKRGTWCATYEDEVQMFWENNQFLRTISLDSTTNIALVRSSPKFNKFGMFCQQVSKLDSPIDENVFMAMPGIEEHDDDTDDTDDDGDDEVCGLEERKHPDLPDEVFRTTDEGPKQSAVDIVPEQTEIPEDQDVQGTTPQAEFLAWHCRLGHLPFDRIKHMVKRGDLPNRLLTCKTPKCSACLFGKATERPWRTKAPVNKFSVSPAKIPGGVIVVDQLVSSTPGLIRQMKGFLTIKRYVVMMAFVDHFSGLSFVHNQMSTGAAHTI